MILGDPMGQLRAWTTLLGTFDLIYWSLCGVFFIMALVSEPSRDTKLAVFVLLVEIESHFEGLAALTGE